MIKCFKMIEILPYTNVTHLTGFVDYIFLDDSNGTYENQLLNVKGRHPSYTEFHFEEVDKPPQEWLNKRLK